MRVIVLGAGVVGVTTAYYLSRLGCDVTVVDRARAVGSGATFGNAGQLSYSFTDSLAKPGFLAQLPRLLLGRDPQSQVRLSPGLVDWGMRFVAQCTSRKARQNTLAVLDIALRSADLLAEIREELDLEFSYRQAGKLVLLSDEAELAAAKVSSELKSERGCETTILGRREAIDIEPALDDMSEDFIAAVYSEDDDVADSNKFTSGLQDWLESKSAAEFRLDSRADNLLMRRGRACGIATDDDEIEADAVVVCLGAWSQGLLRTTGINPHIYPVRGYSISLPPGPSAPAVSMTALRHKLVYSRINGFMRIAGFADFVGFDTGADADRVRALLDSARQLAPQAADYDADDAMVWGGFRPMRPDGRPQVGPTRIDGLYLNTGHGMLGWTLACATAYDAARAVVRTH
ncbi:MAG: FAD-dependent oxidoreductase [Gammaproteobacteria bacterium]|nr:FAD-dependent oxidoreductase [Gammaproteobacteria bacterium]NNF49682.1 FAD-dependent oxidoreductase [Woeseiaceae bacterium]MBT8095095.1 FAD-dependent oxidoreductase [Gammaproteobacteria bacterium]MBT8105409.1 FAD-dependent oxidoreductase [Gammaproteobacteria bacterium]NNK25423.1 FAD-dependent oxidoreductase [Woeseiaceae bacterium]